MESPTVRFLKWLKPRLQCYHTSSVKSRLYRRCKISLNPPTHQSDRKVVWRDWGRKSIEQIWGPWLCYGIASQRQTQQNDSLEANQSSIAPVTPDHHSCGFAAVLDMMSAAMYDGPDLSVAMNEPKLGILEHVFKVFGALKACPTSSLSTFSKYFCVLRSKTRIPGPPSHERLKNRGVQRRGEV